MRYGLLILILTVLTCVSCKKDSTGNNRRLVKNPEYIILPGSPEKEGEDWFNVKNIYTNQIRGVQAVVQINGGMYLPTMSMPPSFNCKVVHGYFIADTLYILDQSGPVFHVTEHLRDTLLVTWGGL
jgi:hypothetical protein